LQKEIFETTLVDLTELFVPPPPTPEPQLNTAPPAPKLPTNQMVNPIVVTDKKVIDDTDDGKLPDELRDPDTGNKADNKGDGKITDNNDGRNTKITNLDSISNVPFRVVEEMPEFPGGIEALTKYLSSQVKYPRQYLEMNVNGTVYLSFVINKKGKVTDITVLKGLRESDAFEIEAMKAISSMPDWKPGKQNSKEVSVMYTLPVAFHTR
jgi:protein TonB